MAKACTDVFAIVGGGWAQDNLIFCGKDGSDFHKCKLIAVPGFAVSTDFAEANDRSSRFPTRPTRRPRSASRTSPSSTPTRSRSSAWSYGNLPSIVQNKDQIIGVAKTVDGFGSSPRSPTTSSEPGLGPHRPAGDGHRCHDAVSFVGEPQNMAKLSQALKDQGYDGVLIRRRQPYDELIIEAAGPEPSRA